MSYDFDPTDDWNIASITDRAPDPDVTRTYTFDIHDQVQTVNGLASGFVYDAAGQLTCDGERVMAWDDQGRLAAVTRAGVTTVYAYDPFNRLVAERTGASGPTTIHLWDGWMQLGEYQDGAGSAPADISYLGGPTGFMGAYRPGTGYTPFAHDPQGSRKDPLEDTPIYEPYGSPLAAAPAPDPPIAFQGHEWRAEAGLYYARNRWYDPKRGAFLSPDPILQATVNDYIFADANPVLLGDPLGLDAVIVGSLVRHSGRRTSTRFEAAVYTNTSLQDYRDGRAGCAALDVGLGIEAFNDTAKQAKAAAGSGPLAHYGTYMDTPPGWYVVEKSPPNAKHRIAISYPGESPPGTATFNGVKRTALRLHGGGPGGSKGCLTAGADWSLLERMILGELEAGNPVWLFVPQLHPSVLPSTRDGQQAAP